MHSIRIYMEDCVWIENRIFFFAKDWNGLFSIDLESKKIEIVSTMPEESFMTKRLCAGIIYHKGKLILVPMTAKKIWIYDLRKNQWLGLKRKYVSEEDSHKLIFRAIKYKDDLFMIGSDYPAIIRMNMYTYKLEYFTEPYDFLTPLKNDSECYFRSDFLVQDNQLFLASCLNNYVLYFNLDTFDYKWHEVGNSKCRYSGIAWDGKYYWLSPRRGTPIVRWDGESKIDYFPLPEVFDDLIYNFSGVQYNNRKLFFPGLIQSKTLVIDACRPHDMKVHEGQYTFYRCFSNEGLIAQTFDGVLHLKDPVKNMQYHIECEIRHQKWLDFYGSNAIEEIHQKLLHTIQIESVPLQLYTYINLSSKSKILENKKLEIGLHIWKCASSSL